MNRYIIRAIKYFFYFCILLTIVMAILVTIGATEANLATMFKNGYDSFWQIGLFFAFMSALYPKFGYTKRQAIVPGELSEIKADVIKVMSDRGYLPESENGEVMTFRFKSTLTRVMRMFEDRVTLTKEQLGFTVEGPTKDITRVVSALEYKFRYNEEENN